MAGFSKVYVVGGEGGFQGSDGVSPIAYQILVGDANRCWFEPHYFDPSIKPIGNIRMIIPAAPGEESLLDAVLAFSPSFFKACPSLAAVEAKLKDVERLNFDAELEKIPAEWQILREEAKEIYSTLHIWQADLLPMNLE